MTSIDVIVPTFNNVDELTRCIASLQAQTHAPARILVCVDGSTDGTLEYLASVADRGQVPISALTHPGNANHGRAATRNLALPELDDGYVWYVDSDMELAPDALEAHLALIEERACTSQGQVVYANASEATWAGYLDTRAYHRCPDRATLPFNWFSAANALVRASFVKEVSGFNAKLSGYGGEDMDLAYRLERIASEPLVNNRLSIATTVETKTVDRALAQFEEYGATNLHVLESLHPEMPRLFELQRLESRRLQDRAFVAAVDSRIVGGIVDRLTPIAPRRWRHQFLNYKLISAVWRGYRSGMVSQ